jgi:hypothetical protein
MWAATLRAATTEVATTVVLASAKGREQVACSSCFVLSKTRMANSTAASSSLPGTVAETSSTWTHHQTVLYCTAAGSALSW